MSEIETSCDLRPIVRHIPWVILAVVLADTASAQVNPQGVRRQPSTRPTLTCSTAPPPQVSSETFNTYVHLNFGIVPADSASVLAFKSFLINRVGPDQRPVRIAEITQPGGTFYDTVPDPRYPYRYTVTAMRRDGCYGSTALTAGPFRLENPSLSAMRAAAPEVVNLAWYPTVGAIKYRIDGPGIPNTGLNLGNANFAPGSAFPQFPISSFGVTTSVPCKNCPPQFVYAVPDPGPGQLTYRIVALYPGNFADYANARQVVIPPVPVCNTAQIAPQSGPAGTSVAITGNNFFFVRQVYRLDRWGKQYLTAPFKVVSSTMITTTSAFDGPFKIETPAGTCTSSNFTIAAAPPTPKVTVPGVVGKTLKDAQQSISQAGLVPKLIAGPGLDTSIVNSEAPSLGAKVSAGSEVDLTTATGGLTGVSKLVLLNDLTQGLALSMFDTSTGDLSPQNGGNILQPGQTTTINFDKAILYLIYGFDPQSCNEPVSCFQWQRGWYGDPGGPVSAGSMSGNP